MFYVGSIWSWSGAAGPSTTDHTGVSLYTGVTEETGVSKASTRGVSGYLNYFIGTVWLKIGLFLAAGMSSVTYAGVN